MNRTNDFDKLIGFLHGQMANMTQPERRVYLHDLLRDENRKLQVMFKQFGIIWQSAQFHNAGYDGAFAGHTAKTLADQYGVAAKDLTQRMSAEALQVCVMRAMQAESELKEMGSKVVGLAILTHRSIGTALRLYLIDNGYARPETLLPAGESVESVRKRLARGGDLFALSGIDDDEEPQEGC